MTPATQRAAGLWACTTLIWLTADPSAVVTVPQGDVLRSARAARTVDVSADGRYVAFESWARLVAADTDTQPDIYVLDRDTGNVTLESVDVGNGQATYPRLSGDGRLIVFEWRVAADATHVDIVCRDRVTLVSRNITGPASGAAAWNRHPAISANGKIAAFSSASTALVPGSDANGMREDVYTFDLSSGEMRRASVTSDHVQPSTGDSISPSLSADGRWLAFASTAPLDPSSKAGSADRPRRIFLRDLVRGTTRLISRARGGGAASGDSSYPAVSADGRFVAFTSDASNLVSGDDRNRGADVFLFDRETEAIVRVSRGADGSSPSGVSIHPAISADGRYIAFQSDAPNLACAGACRGRDGDINLLWDVFLFDRVAGRTRRLSEDELGGWMEWSGGPAIDGAGGIVAFSSRHATGPEDRRDDLDLYVQRIGPPPRPRPRPPP